MADILRGYFLNALVECPFLFSSTHLSADDRAPILRMQQELLGQELWYLSAFSAGVVYC